MAEWTDSELRILRENYPQKGKEWSAAKLGRSVASVRMKAHRLGLKQDRDGEFFKDWQRRAAESKVGKKRPEQAEVMRRNHRQGKLKKSAKQRRAVGKRTKKWIEENGHPKGALGLKHSDETKAVLSKKSKAAWAKMTDEQIAQRSLKAAKTSIANGTYHTRRKRATWKAGWRIVGEKRRYFRSRWEANYARYLQWLKTTRQILEWEHEPDTFYFEGVKRGTVSYLPDFRVQNMDETTEYHEVKGWMDKRSKTKIKRMAKYHPDVRLIVIDSKAYKSLAKDVGGFIVDWE